MADVSAATATSDPMWERIPRAQGSLLRGWIAVGRRRREQDAHHAIAAWAATMTSARIAWTLATAALIDVCSGLIGAIFVVTHGRLSVHALGAVSAYSAISGVFFHLAEFLAIATVATALVAALRHYGSFRRRFERMIRPWTLVQVPIALAGLTAALLLPLSQIHFGDITIPILDLTLPMLSFLGSCLFFYSIYLTLTSLAVGAYRFIHVQVIYLLAFLTWIGTYFAYNALAGWLQHALRIGG